LEVFVDTPVLCGHRGSGSGVVAGQRENTLGSFQTAVEAGLRWVEVDARATADGALVACHAPVADGRFVSEMTVEEAGELGLMHVAELLDELPGEVGVNIDVKTALEDALRPRERTTGALVSDLVGGRSRRLLVSSFDPAAVLIVRERVPHVPVGLLTWGRFPLRKAIAGAVHLGVDVVAPYVAAFPLRPDPHERAVHESIRVAHAAGIQVLAWGSQPPETEQLMDAGVDCVIVDDVPRAVARRQFSN
jgi:glycerophosphoryl diester phosphodiesterase